MRAQAEESGIIGSPSAEGNWLHKLHYDLRNVVQLSEPMPIAADSAEQALDYIFGRQIIDPQSQARERAVTKMRVVSDLRNAYRRAKLADRYIEARPELYVGAHVHTLLDFAVVAGQTGRTGQTVQISQGWSFARTQFEDVPVEVKAWGYAVEQLRRDKGARLITAGGAPREITSEVDVQVVIVEPQTAEQMRAFEEADQVFRQLRATVRPLAEVDGVGNQAAQLVAKVGY
jgi:uncharacterized protein (DUF1330 family)